MEFSDEVVESSIEMYTHTRGEEFMVWFKYLAHYQYKYRYVELKNIQLPYLLCDFPYKPFKWITASAHTAGNNYVLDMITFLTTKDQKSRGLSYKSLFPVDEGQNVMKFWSMIVLSSGFAITMPSRCFMSSSTFLVFWITHSSSSHTLR